MHFVCCMIVCKWICLYACNPGNCFLNCENGLTSIFVSLGKTHIKKKTGPLRKTKNYFSMTGTSWNTRKINKKNIACYVQCWSISINRKFSIWKYYILKLKFDWIHLLIFFLSILDHFQVIKYCKMLNH